MKNNLWYVLGLVILLASCQEDEDFQVNYSYDYYPLETEHTVVYDVDSIVISEFTGTVDTLSFQVKEVIDSAFTDLEGETRYKLFKYKRTDTTQSWGSPRVWWVKRNQNTLEKSEENLKFIKLTFPPEEGFEWEGNTFIEIDESIEYLEGWTYTYEAVDEPMTINGMLFDSTLTVQHIDEENLINKTFSKEVYAKGVGMIYREVIYLNNSGNTDVFLPWYNLDRWDKDGFILTMRINSYSD